MKAIAVLLFLFSFLFNPISFAQQAVLSSGGDTSGSGGSLSYSVGQIAYHTNSATSGESSAEGVQHAYEIYAYASIEEGNTNSFTVTISPNPATDIINIKSIEFAFSSYSLFDFKGKLLKTKKLNSENTIINLEKYSRGSYLLKIKNKNQLVKSFKIIKN